ncbi:uncharacterized protein BO80DRAFT_421796 [Aspergillus ibericus CBS 121593]|uniref:Uncharacterized protein n=1 Tax=Aspergillus ibericus CBS 121593 TaxID=1448316 RepID=A0A395H9Z8_9EURO|nr:hypothetical protein BO80DRAFT_421796 [Aspergillus ibericus CBS 121593]RAL04500.1 hypothetical protein BO80DRAFT_421796 [Aspergillus ibericus CBS 121593]
MHRRVYTYVLAPRWDFRPDGPIALGNIIVDPFRPHRVLTKPDPAIPPPEIETVVETEWEMHQERELGMKTSIWTHFLEAMGVDLGLESTKSLSAEYNVESLTTSYFKEEPSAEEIARRTQDPMLREMMRLDSPFSKPVYMVTGIKIAKGFRASEGHSRSREANGGASAGTAGTVVGDVTIGTNNKVFVKESDKRQAKSENDIVFAYQLMKIVPKGWKHKVFDFQDFYPKAAVLLDEAEVQNGVDVSFATAADFAECKHMKVNFSMAEVIDSHGTVQCIAVRG